MKLIRRGWRAMWFMDDDDNTSQGKLARGLFYVFYWIVGALLLMAVVDAVDRFCGRCMS